MRTRSIVASLLLATACAACESETAKTPPRTVKKKVDTTRIPVPNHSPQVMNDPGKPRRPSVEGKMDATVTGRMQHFTFFARGQNAAVFFADTGVAWLRVTGALSDEGTPSLSFKLETFNLGRARLPATYVVRKTKQSEPVLEAEYTTGPLHRWHSSLDTDQPLTLTIDSFEDHTLRGTFSGVLLPENEGDKPVVLEDGTFEVTLRLTNVPAGPKPEPAP